MDRDSWIERLVPRPEPGLDPALARRAALPGAIRGALVSGYAALRADWRQARAAHSGILRQARSLGSKERRFIADLLAFLVRRERTIALLCERAGLQPQARRDRVELARVQAALVLGAGLAPGEIREPGIDWASLADPVHVISGWAREGVRSDAEVFGVAASLPDHVAARLLLLPDPPGLAAALNGRAPLCLRANRARISRADALALLAGLGIEARPGGLAGDALVLDDHVDANALPPVKEGLLDVQDEGSQLMVELCDPMPGWKVIDACAGALGKSLALASRMGGRGSILAVDPRTDALGRGMARARRCGFTSIRTMPLSRLGRPDGRADLVLVDAPCSGSGALRRRPWTRWAVQEADLARLPAEQLAILDRFAGFVRPSGRLVYATCSLFDEENEAVVQRFLSLRPEWRLVPACDILGAERAARMGDGRVMLLLPHRHGTDGFFAAVLARR